ncbi:MAG TPA: SRPBCC domain-containing protein [Puia sp.]|nr:SRPBCC domain-containing protein [Puia sp.]
MSQVYDWEQFVKRVTIKAPQQEIFDAWATQAGLESWFLRKAEFTDRHKKRRERHSRVEAGDTYLWLWFGYPDSMNEQHTILESNGKDHLKFRFSGGCLVTVTVKSEQGETICELAQEMSPAEAGKRQMFYIECGKGWTFYLANLKSVLEGGLDLRNKNPSIQSVINA